MDGIVVVYDPLGRRERIAELVPSLCQALLNWAGDRQSEWHIGTHFGLGRCQPGSDSHAPQLVWSEDKAICIVFSGDIYGCDSLRHSLERAENQSHDDSVAQFVIHLYKSRGDAFVHELNGRFALALWDSRQQKIITANDRYGLCPLYHAQVGGMYLWASSPRAILAHPAFHRQVNLAALADFLCLGIPQGNDTMFEGIQEVPPATLLTCLDGRVQCRQYWDLSFQEDETEIPADEYLEELISLLVKSGERRLAGEQRVGLLLSGGYDSRVVLSVLGRTESDPWVIEAFTLGTLYCDDVVLARRVTQTANVPHTILEIKPSYLETFACDGIARTPDLICCDQFHGISVYDRVSSRADVLITGSAGEDILGHFVRDPHSRFWGDGFSVDRYYDSKRIMTDRQLEQLLQPAYSRPMMGLARARFRYDFEKYASRHNTHRIDYWSVRQQQRRLYNRLSSLFPHDVRFSPLYYDNDLIDFVQTIPPSMRWGEGSIYRRVVPRVAPELAKIPLTTTCGLPLHATHQQVVRRKSLYKCWRRWYARISRHSRGLVPPPRMSRHFVDYGNWLRNDLLSWARAILLDSQTLGRDYWNPSAIEQVIENHLHGKGYRTRQLAALISFELWHRLYLDELDIAHGARSGVQSMQV